MKKWQSTLVLFLSVFVLYALYLWFVKESQDLPRLLLESLGFSALLTIISTTMDALRSRFTK